MISAQTNSTTNATVHVHATGQNIYDESADGSKQISDALALAAKEHRRVLLEFGANWCIWCHRLHTLFETDRNVAAALKRDYVVVMIDTNHGHNGDWVDKYNTNKFGIPFLVILDADGKHLVTSRSGVFVEGDHHNPEKVLSFLNQWAPTH